MHNGMIQSTGEKMAKSAGNIAPLHEVVERYGRETVVMYLVSAAITASRLLSPRRAGAGTGQRQPHPRGGATAGPGAARPPRTIGSLDFRERFFGAARG